MLSQSQAVARPKRDRRVCLTKVDKRTAFGRRVMELRSVFAETFSQAELSPLRLLKIREAAELKAIAEKARGDFMRDGVGNLDDIVRIERKADLAVRALHIVDAGAAKATSPLAAHFASPPVREACG